MCGSNFDSTPVTQFAKPTALNIYKSILQPNFQPNLQEDFLKASGKLCCNLFLKYSDVKTYTDIDTFISNLERHYNGRRQLKYMGNLIVDEIQQPNGQCACTIIRDIVVADASLMCSVCCRQARETLFGTVLRKPVVVRLLDTPVCTDSEVCRWLIEIKLVASEAT